MSATTYVLGGFQTDFAKNYARQGHDISDIVRDTVAGTLASAQVKPDLVEAIHFGNAFGELFTGQAQLGAMPASVEPALDGLPSMRHEAACASGSMAVLGAMADIEAGRYDCVLVVGAEQERNVPGDIATQHLGAAAWVGREGQDARYMWPHLFDRLATEYSERHGLKHEHLAAIAQKNFSNARANENAQTRGWTFPEGAFGQDDRLNPVIEGRIRRQDCSQLTDGGAGLVVCSGEFASRHNLTPPAQFLGWGHRSSTLDLETKLTRSRRQPLILPHVAVAIGDALRRAGVGSARDLSAIETHDCFTITEYLAIDHFGLTPPGESWRAIEDGTVSKSGTVPINPSGGLIGAGHPVGASGIRMLVDAVRQVSGSAEACQVPEASRVATLNIGGSCTTVASFVVGQTQESA